MFFNAQRFPRRSVYLGRRVYIFIKVGGKTFIFVNIILRLLLGELHR